MKFDDLLERLRELDLLLDADAKFPSVSTEVLGGNMRGSWWTHPEANEMYRLSCLLRSHPDVLMAKLVSGKVTMIHRPLWHAVFVIGTAREAWQMKDLSKDAKALLKKVDKEKMVKASGDPVRDLEARLLVHAEAVHTEHGSHSKQMQSWESWADRAMLGEVNLTVGEAKSQLEQVVARLNKQSGATGTLPWKQRGARS